MLSAALTAALAATALIAANTASAAPTGDTSAADTVKALQEQGYSVQINGEVVGSLADCTVTGVHGVSGLSGLSGTAPTSFTTAYVDISCPSGDA
jgi:hypothetical protein